jgi:hypothetical protein
MDFIYLYETELENLSNCFKWDGEGAGGRDNGANVTNVHHKSNQNCSYEPPCIINIYNK